jgi:hypothetical protein
MNNRGVIYCATSQAIYLEAALISACALRHLNPDLPITIFCDRPLEAARLLKAYDITAIEVISGKGAFLSRNLKTQLANLSPYRETLYIDSDILPLKSIAPIWDYLNHADILMVLDRLPTIAQCDHIAVEERDYTLQFLPGTTPQFNSGVMLWQKNPATEILFTQWQREWHRFQKHDQLALVRAIAQSQVFVNKLPVNYNISPIDSAPVLLPKNEVYLLHCWGGKVASGAYRQLAGQYYPEIVRTVVDAMAACV